MSFKETFRRIPFATTALLLIVVLVADLFFFSTQIELLNDRKNLEIQNIKENYWVTVDSIIEEERKIASDMSEDIAIEFRKDLIESYRGNMEQLKEDINNPKSDTELSRLARENVNGHFMNVDNDNNDPFITFIGEVYYDGSLNCSECKSRTWDKIVKFHWNKELAVSALKSLEEQSTSSILFWEFLQPDDEHHERVIKMKKESLRIVFMNEGLEGLSTYEFLEPTYIDRDKDIFGKYRVDYRGNEQETDQIIVVQGFNIVDAIKKDYKHVIEHYKGKFEQAELKYHSDKIIIEIGMIFKTLILMSVFIYFINLHNNFSSRKSGEKDKENA